jgi:hypothetical protein
MLLALERCRARLDRPGADALMFSLPVGPLGFLLNKPASRHG